MTSLSVTEGLVAAGVAGAVVGFAVSVTLVPAAIRLSKRLDVLDEPGARSSHTVRTPRLGGLAVAAGALVGLGVAMAAQRGIEVPTGEEVPDLESVAVVAAIATLFGAIGLWDDLARGVDVSIRLLAQGVLGLGLVLPWLVAERSGTTLVIVGGIAGAVWVVGFVNAFNFMDGVDGMSGMVGAVVGLDLAVVGALTDEGVLILVGLVLTGAAAGFLPHNLRKAKVFLGDGGSYFIGAWIAVSVLAALVVDVRPEAVFAVAVPCLVDTSSTLVRRIARGDDWRTSHHEHAYQQLAELGWSHPAVSGLVAGISACCAALGLVSLHGSSAARVASMVGILGLGAAYVLLPQALRRRGTPQTAGAPREA